MTINLFLLFAFLAALLHCLFFYLESIAWMKPKTYKTFGVKEESEAKILKLLYFNQGFYNLFLAFGVFVGIYLMTKGFTASGIPIILFACSCMFGASMVLFFSKPGMLRAVLIQGLCPFLSILFYLIS
jgi:putative membrane protein